MATDRETSTVTVYEDDLDRLHDENRRGETLADTVSRLLAGEDASTENPDESIDE